MTNSRPPRTGKTHRQENFPVASFVIRAEHRPIILAFYYFVRAADDVADSSALTPDEKIARLDGMEAELVSDSPSQATTEAAILRLALADRGLSPRHAQDLLKAFRLDATKKRYPDWGELMAYCALSAMPVGRFVLDVHGESPATWPASDAICAALQIINHLQDCGEDYRELDRVYVPLDALAARGVGVEALGGKVASPGLRLCVADLSRRCEGLLRDGGPLADEIMDWRLRLEISVIRALALRLTDVLIARDPLAGKVHLGKWEAGGATLLAIAQAALRGRRFASRATASEARP